MYAHKSIWAKKAHETLNCRISNWSSDFPSNVRSRDSPIRQCVQIEDQQTIWIKKRNQKDQTDHTNKKANFELKKCKYFKLYNLFNLLILTISATRSIPYEKTIALGGVAIGNVNAKELANTVGKISANGFFPIFTA